MQKVGTDAENCRRLERMQGIAESLKKEVRDGMKFRKAGIYSIVLGLFCIAGLLVWDCMREEENVRLPVPVVKEENTIYKNVYIDKIEGSKLLFYNGGTLETVNIPDSIQTGEVKTKVLGDICLNEDGTSVEKLSLKPDTITGRVLSVGTKKIEIEGYGKLPIEKEAKVYKLPETEADAVDENNATGGKEMAGGEPEEKSWKEVLVGSKNHQFVVADKKVCGVFLGEESVPEQIRVVITGNSHKDYFHSKVVITCDGGFVREVGNKKKNYAAGKKLTLKENAGKKKTRIRIYPQNKEDVLKVTSLERNQDAPTYRGVLEVERTKKGLLLVNELSVEDYLCGVLPSEMPAEYDAEALKAQAVCARSYAYQQMETSHGNCAKYGGNVDDTTAYQVYKNQPEQPSTNQAVEETKGEVLTYGGKIASAYYYAVSGGYSAKASDVWGAGTIGYLVSKKLDYDESSPWYSWKTVLDISQIERNIDNILRERWKAAPDLILTKKGNGSFESKDISTVGKIDAIKITEYGEGKIAKKMLIKGSKATIEVSSEYNIRALLAPGNTSIKRKDGSNVKGQTLLPSGFITLKEDRKKGLCYIRGKGMGHGVGMSQFGAGVMAKEGKNYTEILSYYFPGTKVCAAQ
ncbi:MAG: SpoIID/LytB domain-containing protein [Lachnospiraceae bacterium]|nr:SpoIID/LytB domain-containing protein [Lachnospiraceae bacterium]